MHNVSSYTNMSSPRGNSTQMPTGVLESSTNDFDRSVSTPRGRAIAELQSEVTSLKETVKHQAELIQQLFAQLTNRQ